MLKDRDWLLQSKETRGMFADATWIPYRKAVVMRTGEVCGLDYYLEFFGLRSMAFYEQLKSYAKKHFVWSDIGLHQGFYPYSDQDAYVTVHNFYDLGCKEIIGVRLVYKYAEPVSRKRLFIKHTGVSIYTREVNDEDCEHTNRFHCRDHASLLCFAKDLVRVLLERLNLPLLRDLAHLTKPAKLGFIKLCERLLACYRSEEEIHDHSSIFVGVCELRICNAHPAESKVEDALRLAGVNMSLSYLKQGTQLLVNFANVLRTSSMIPQKEWQSTPPVARGTTTPHPRLILDFFLTETYASIKRHASPFSN